MHTHTFIKKAEIKGSELGHDSDELCLALTAVTRRVYNGMQNLPLNGFVQYIHEPAADLLVILCFCYEEADIQRINLLYPEAKVKAEPCAAVGIEAAVVAHTARMRPSAKGDFIVV